MVGWQVAGACAVFRRLGLVAAKQDGRVLAASYSSSSSANAPFDYGYEHGPIGDDGLPITVDWRKAGAMTPVQDQGTCGTSWSFAAIAAVEGINYIRTGKLVKLSEQQLIDCNGVTNSFGVIKGNITSAFEYIILNGGGGGCLSSCLPLCGQKRCLQTYHSVTIDGYEMVKPDCEQALKRAVAFQPTTVLVKADKRFHLYAMDILDGPNSELKELNHAMVAVGYDETQEGEKYWILKNSQSPSCGLRGGFVYLRRDCGLDGGACGVARSCFYPTKFSPNKVVRVNCEIALLSHIRW